MSLVAFPSTINYGETSKITCFGLTDVSWTPINIINVEYTEDGNSVIVVEPNISTQIYVFGYDSYNQPVKLDIIVYVNIIVSPQTASVDLGAIVELNAYGAIKYEWSPQNYLNKYNGNSVICTPLSDITYTVVGSDDYGHSSSATITISMTTEDLIKITPSNSTIYEGDSITINITNVNNYHDLTYEWISNNYKNLYDLNGNQIGAKYGSSIKINPWQNVEYTVNVYNQGSIIGTYIVSINVIPKPMEILDVDLIPYKLLEPVLNRNKRELMKLLIRYRILSEKIISFYYTQLQVAYTYEFTNKNGTNFRMKWMTYHQVKNQSEETVISFSQQWNFFKFINNNQTRAGYTRSNFAFLMNTVNQLYLEPI